MRGTREEGRGGKGGGNGDTIVGIQVGVYGVGGFWRRDVEGMWSRRGGEKGGEVERWKGCGGEQGRRDGVFAKVFWGSGYG